MNMRNIFLALCIAILVLSAIAPARAEIVDKIAVVVNDEVITEGEIDRALAPIYDQYKDRYEGEELVQKLEQARQKVIEQLIDDKLVYSEAKKLNIEVPDKEVDSRIDDTRKRFGSKETFEAALKEQRITVKDLKERYKEQLMTKRIIDQKIGSKIIVTPVDISNYYNKHIDEFVLPAQLKLKNILIRPKEDLDAQKAHNLINEIARRIREGGEFEALARIYSDGPGAGDGGTMGYVKKGDLMPEIEKVVFNLKVGEVSDVVQTGLGYHMFKLEERTEEKTLSFDEARGLAEEAVFKEKVKERVRTWLDGLKKNAYIALK